jgi:hypothetical protein
VIKRKKEREEIKNIITAKLLWKRWPNKRKFPLTKKKAGK